MNKIRTSQELFTGMGIISLTDDLSHQVLLLTPTEMVQLRDQLNGYEVKGLGIPACEQESASLKALTLYNGHALPSIDREAFERQQTILGPHFRFELRQQIQQNGQIVSKVVGKL